jgi:hypothetical protein
MEQGVKPQTYYERKRETRKEYQRQYREAHLEEVRRKDRERRRKPKKGKPIVVEHSIKVSFE